MRGKCNMLDEARFSRQNATNFEKSGKAIRNTGKDRDDSSPEDK